MLQIFFLNKLLLKESNLYPIYFFNSFIIYIRIWVILIINLPQSQTAGWKLWKQWAGKPPTKSFQILVDTNHL